MKFRSFLTTAGIIALCSSISFGQKNNDTIPKDQIGKLSGQTGQADAGSPGVSHNPCQDDSMLRRLKPTRAYGFIGIGFKEFSLSELNGKLNASGMSGFDSAAFNISLGRHMEIRKLTFEGELSGLAWGENIDNGLKTSLYAMNVQGQIGVNCLPEDGMVSLSPYAGVGLGIAELKIRNDKKTLGRAIENSDPHVILWQGSFLTQIGVAADLILPSPDKKKGFVAGIRCGCQFAPLHSSWYSDDTPIADMPELKQCGVFAKLVLGGWKPLRKQVTGPCNH